MILADFTNAALPVLLIAEPVHLQDVMREAYEGPLGAHLVATTQQKLPESARLFDLPEHRFHNRLAGRVDRFARLGLQLASHTIHHQVSLVAITQPLNTTGSLPHIQVEFRQDEIQDEISDATTQHRWALRFAQTLMEHESQETFRDAWGVRPRSDSLCGAGHADTVQDASSRWSLCKRPCRRTSWEESRLTSSRQSTTTNAPLKTRDRRLTSRRRGHSLQERTLRETASSR